MISLKQEPTLEEKRAQLARVGNSAVLQNAPMLQKLLQFVGTCGTEGTTSEINEWVIATTVFGRSKDFDSSTDTTVRTSVYRLRSKLREYYANEGRHDSVLIEIPKGHYVPIFSKRELDVPSNPVEETGVDRDFLNLQLPAQPVAAPAAPKRGLLVGIAVLLVGASLFAGRYWGKTAALPRTGTSPRSVVLAQFWRAFAGNGRPVIVAYSNAELLQTDTRDLVRYDIGAIDDRGATVDQALAARSVRNPEMVRQHNLFYEDGYTGIGEVQSVFSLTRLLTQLGIDISVKRVRLLTTDDLNTHNVVLLGSTLENRAIDDLRLKQGYTFDLPLHSMWAGRIVDKRPGSSANPASYTIERDPTTQALRVDYAVVSMMPGIAPDRRIMLLGGLTTSGTQGAAELVSSDQNLTDLLQRLDLPREGFDQDHPLPFFESVLQVRVVRGLDPVSIKCVAVRRIPK